MGTNDDSSPRERATFSPAHGAASADHFKRLFDDIEERIGRLTDTDSSEINKLRAKVRVALVVARSALKDAADQLQIQAQQVAKELIVICGTNPGRPLASWHASASPPECFYVVDNERVQRHDL